MIRNAVEFLILHAVFIVPVVLAILVVVSSTVRTAVRFLLRLIARPVLLLAVVALVYDGTRTLAGGSGIVITPLLEHWQAMAPRSLAALQGFTSRVLSPAAWDGVMLRVVMLPAWLTVGVLGFVLAWLGRKPQRTKVFIN